MFGFVGRCMKMSVATLLMCQNDTKFVYTTIADSIYNIKSGEYIHATLEQSESNVNAYTIGILFARSFKRDMSGRRLNQLISSNVLTLRVTYTNSEPRATAAELNDGFWNDTHTRSVNSIFYESSYGELEFNKNTSRVATVHLNASIETTRIGCDTNQMFALAGPAAIAAGIDTSAFTHIQYILPQNYGSTCDWDGLSAIGCSVPGEFIFDNCFAVFRSSTVFTRAHELGHNFGMLHAAGCGLRSGECTSAASTTYGDATAIMGGASNQNRTGGFIAPNRINMGWIGNTTNGSQDGRFTIGALSTWPSTYNTAIRIPCVCPVSAQMGDSCEIIVSYRVPTRVDSSIMDAFAYTVSVHLKSTEISNTLLITSLGLGDSYKLLTGKVLFVCDTSDAHTLVFIGEESALSTACDDPGLNEAAIIIGVLAAVIVSVFGTMLCTYVYRAQKSR